MSAARLLSPASLKAIPKAELHCHLLGTVRRNTFTELARRANSSLSDTDIESFYTRGEKPVGVLRVLRALDADLLQSPDDLHRISYEYLQDAAAHQVCYAEFFWNPTGTVVTSGIPYAKAQAAIVQAIADAQTDCGIIARLVPAIDREATPEQALEMVQWLIAITCAHWRPSVGRLITRSARCLNSACAFIPIPTTPPYTT